jgi:NAD(P)-dependent dehydrogenase (short-subunit alcohol dehydrogenase family)
LLYSINSKCAFLVLKAGSKYVSDGGKLITIVTALLAAFTGYYTSYAGSKAPVEHFTRGVAKELQPRLVSVNAVAPGPMDTRKLLSLLATLNQKRSTNSICF